MTNNEIVPGFDDTEDNNLAISLERIDEVPNCLVVFLNGRVDTSNANDFQKRVAKAIEAGFVRLIFSFVAFNFVSDLVIGCLTAFLKVTKSRGGDLVIVDVEPGVWECFQLLGFSLFFNCRKNVESAVSYFRQIGRFPKIFRCAFCSEWLESGETGWIRCEKCGAEFTISATGDVSAWKAGPVAGARKIGANGRPATRKLTVMLTNIVDYVSLCERVQLGLLELLNAQYFKPVQESIVSCGGSIGEIIGDRQAAYWGGNRAEENAIQSCRAAIMMTNRIALERTNLPRDHRFAINIGIASEEVRELALGIPGPVVFGVGNEARRLVERGKCLSKRILIDHETCRQNPRRLKTRTVESETLKGLPIYELLAVYK